MFVPVILVSAVLATCRRIMASLQSVPPTATIAFTNIATAMCGGWATVRSRTRRTCIGPIVSVVGQGRGYSVGWEHRQRIEEGKAWPQCVAILTRFTMSNHER